MLGDRAQQRAAIVRQRAPARASRAATVSSGMALAAALALVCLLQWSLDAIPLGAGPQARAFVSPPTSRAASVEVLRPTVRLRPSP